MNRSLYYVFNPTLYGTQDQRVLHVGLEDKSVVVEYVLSLLNSLLPASEYIFLVTAVN
jgi:hypothetical protein